MNMDGEKISENSEKEPKRHELRQTRNPVLIDAPINKLNKERMDLTNNLIITARL